MKEEVEITVTPSGIHVVQVVDGKIVQHNIIDTHKEIADATSKGSGFRRVRVPLAE
jgi:hypothetical protein